MAQFETKIFGFEVSVDNDMEGDGRVTGCWINKGEFGGSLALLEAQGFLEDRDGNELPVSDSTVASIVKYAESKGY